MIKFGTGGWRAIIGEEFTMDNVRLLSQALVQDLKASGGSKKGFVIGYDRRFLSDRAARWMAEVIAGNGIKVFFIDKNAPTPMIMFTVKEYGTTYGASVTASHNPAEYNGIKVFTGGGKDADQKVTSKLEKIIDSIRKDDIKVMEFIKGLDTGIIEKIYPSNEYLDAIIKMVDLDSIRKSKLRILLDPMFGVSRSSLQTILVTARCDLDVINDRHDTLFGGRLPSPTAKTLARLKDIVLEQGYDLGIATDGDADRLGIIDDKGAFIHPNDIMVLLYYYLASVKGWSGGVVRNISTTHLLDRIAESLGEKCYEVPVGFKYISRKMEQTDAVLGGESSGGLAVRGHIKGKDGIFAAALLVEMISVTGKKISEMMEAIHERFGYLCFVERDFKMLKAERERISRLLFTEKSLPEFEFPIKKVSRRDGVKVYFENDGWVIARFSGTEPLIRIFSEMPSIQEARQVNCTIQKFLGLKGDEQK